ncbi:TPA: hypothetical protein N3D26_004561 [Salmonella enterica subsp. enterica serovar Bredeney]|uniref:hypothetical protein n=1 Tax=Salmonella enterica TaxID=28901 RepID=UPI0002D4CCD5|nr:hypothetical protein [Salmonella enterica]ECB6474630.1 hypothetical protein [Salmonella enterica subsp. enterica serovar Alachua]ECD4223050.1 hypothetical protein [Salmonella enterica subsp. enterica serovar Bredeney]ECF0872444.1 hypothetical protein [Salmonella enterica subsp. enterica serovar Newport]EDC6187913.1 hypothetical protein [Salmonella enterica subsp. enterica serovar Schwarzengrund]EDV3175142.1 hypothetical protein [Salmonella enterica subsp. enterica serovar Bonn]EDV5548407.1
MAEGDLRFTLRKSCRDNTEHAAVLYSLSCTSHLNDVGPEKWLRYAVENIREWPTNRVHNLLS